MVSQVQPIEKVSLRQAICAAVLLEFLENLAARLAVGSEGALTVAGFDAVGLAIRARWNMVVPWVGEA